MDETCDVCGCDIVETISNGGTPCWIHRDGYKRNHPAKPRVAEVRSSDHLRHGVKILRPGHRYELFNFDKVNEPGQELQFIEKRPYLTADADPKPAMETVNDGTTNEAVLEVLINRLQFLNAKFPCRENAIVITHLETALLFLEKRTRDRQARGVDGQHKA